MSVSTHVSAASPPYHSDSTNYLRRHQLHSRPRPPPLPPGGEMAVVCTEIRQGGFSQTRDSGKRRKPRYYVTGLGRSKIRNETRCGRLAGDSEAHQRDINIFVLIRYCVRKITVYHRPTGMWRPHSASTPDHTALHDPVNRTQLLARSRV